MSDPYVIHYFTIKVPGIGDIAHFREVTGLETKVTMVEQMLSGKDGKTIVHKVPTDSVQYGDIVLKRAVTSSTKLWDWRKQVEEGKFEAATCNGSIELSDMTGKVVARWNFIKGWPSKISGPSLSAESDEVATEELTISHEGLQREL